MIPRVIIPVMNTGSKYYVEYDRNGTKIESTDLGSTHRSSSHSVNDISCSTIDRDETLRTTSNSAENVRE